MNIIAHAGHGIIEVNMLLVGIVIGAALGAAFVLGRITKGSK